MAAAAPISKQQIKQQLTEYLTSNKADVTAAYNRLDTVERTIQLAIAQCQQGNDSKNIATYEQLLQHCSKERSKLHQTIINTTSPDTFAVSPQKLAAPAQAAPSIAPIFKHTGTMQQPIDITEIQSDDALLAQHSAAIGNNTTKNVNDVLKPVTNKQLHTANDSKAKSSWATTVEIEDDSKQNRFKRSKHNDSDSEQNDEPAQPAFMSASAKQAIDQAKKYGRFAVQNSETGIKRLGRTGDIKKFKSPVIRANGIDNANVPSYVKKALSNDKHKELPERLKGCDPKLVEMIENEMMEQAESVKWSDIAGLEFAKKSVQEIVVWPMKRPDVFKGLRAAPKGILLFGPPGTGKTLIGKAIASEAGAKFFNISASSLTSKWHGEGEKLMRTLFAVAGHYQPSIIFIDEIDSLLTQRSDSEFEASRRIKTEFLVQFDGVGTNKDERVLVVGATNRPQELDEAARRRLVKRLYIPLPDARARAQLINILLEDEANDLSESDIDTIVQHTAGYSGADIRALCTEAAYGPIRSLENISDIESMGTVRPINLTDFFAAFRQVRASVSKSQLSSHIAWNKQYGSVANDPGAKADQQLAETGDSEDAADTV